MNTIDIVRRAREDVLANPDKYSFGDYTRCAVGHVYKAVTGSYARGEMTVLGGGTTEFRSVMEDINKALGHSTDLVGHLSNRAVPPTIVGVRRDRGPLAVKFAVGAYDQVLEVLDKAHDRSLDA
jgi:hypothetical protein